MTATHIIKAGRYQDTSTDPKKAAHTVLLPLEGRNGFVFALWSIDHRTDGASIGAIVLEHTGRLASTFGSDANPQHRFEQFLSALNERLANGVREGVWQMPVSNFNALVGIACDDVMYLSGCGELTTLFLHRKPSQRYQIFNLFRGIQTEQSLPSWDKAFAVILDGELHIGDIFCAANKDLPRFLPADDLNTFLATLPPASAAEKIRQYFPHNAALALLIVQVQQTPEIAGEQAAQPLSDVSLGRLDETRDTTTRLLEDQKPSLFASLRGMFPNRRRRHAIAGQTQRSGTAVRTLRTVAALLLALAGIIGRAALALGRWFGRISLALSRKEGRRETKNKIAHAFTWMFQRFHLIPRTSKYLLLASVGVLIVFSVSIGVLARSQAQTDERKQDEAQVTRVEEKRDQAAGAVIYKDENRARTLYHEALVLVDALPTDTPEKIAQAERLRLEINTGLESLRHVVTLPNPPLRASLSAITDGLTAQAMVRFGSELYVFASDKGVYQLDTAQTTFIRVETTDGEVGAALEAASDENRVLFLDGRPGMSRFDAENKTLQITDLTPPDNVLWTDAALYSNRLYVLEQAGADSEGQILRFVPAGTSFGSGTRWIKSKNTDLRDAVSLAIDGSVFVLKRNGSLVRFANGGEVGWTTAVVDPPITNATDVWTDADSTFVYILEPSAKRVIVFNKETGSLVVQYYSDAFKNLSDILVDEPNKTIYLLSGENLFAISAGHLQ